MAEATDTTHKERSSPMPIPCSASGPPTLEGARPKAVGLFAEGAFGNR